MPPYHDAVEPEAGPAPTLARVDGIERRACSKALQWWREHAAPRHMPEIEAVTAAPAGELQDYLFAIEVGEEPAANRFVMAGEALRSALGFDPTGKSMIEVWPRAARERAFFLQKATAELMNPIDEAGRWTNDDGDDVVYRCVLLPLSADQRRVDHLLGAFSFRTIRYG